MVCIHCSGITHVINSRPQKKSNQVWRRRQCFACLAVFTTTESADYSAIWQVSRTPGDVLPFLRDKLYMSIYKSVQHRSTALADAGGLTSTVIQKLLLKQAKDQLTTKQIAATAQMALHRFDSAASVHYAAFHKA